jgi:hypothetical protein
MRYGVSATMIIMIMGLSDVMQVSPLFYLLLHFLFQRYAQNWLSPHKYMYEMETANSFVNVSTYLPFSMLSCPVSMWGSQILHKEC